MNAIDILVEPAERVYEYVEQLAGLGEYSRMRQVFNRRRRELLAVLYGSLYRGGRTRAGSQNDYLIRQLRLSYRRKGEWVYLTEEI